MLDTLMISSTVGNIAAIRWPVRSAVAVSSSLAPANRSVSSGSRTNARTTRMPVICSRSTPLTRSTRACISWNVGTMRDTSEPRMITAAGIANTRMIESCALSRTAMIDPITMVSGDGDHHRGGEHDEHLDLLDVVGDAGDQRRCAELADLSGRVRR